MPLPWGHTSWSGSPTAGCRRGRRSLALGLLAATQLMVRGCFWLTLRLALPPRIGMGTATAPGRLHEHLPSPALVHPQSLALPPEVQASVELASLVVRGRPYADPAELVPLCPRCGAASPLVGLQVRDRQRVTAGRESDEPWQVAQCGSVAFALQRIALRGCDVPACARMRSCACRQKHAAVAAKARRLRRSPPSARNPCAG